MSLKERFRLQQLVNKNYFDCSRPYTSRAYARIINGLESKMRQAKHKNPRDKKKILQHEANYYDFMQLHPHLSQRAY
jgi:hypothetical protein